MQWKTEHVEALLEAVGVHGSNWEPVARDVRLVRENATSETCRKKYRKLVNSGNDKKFESVLTPMVAYDPSSQASWRERISAASQIKNIRDRDKPFIPIADITIATNKPVAFLVTSDWQLGSLGVDYDMWIDHMDTFISFPDMYMIVNGDIIHNTHTHRTLSAVWQQVMTPEEQALMLGSLSKELVDKDKIIAITLSEEHDQKDARDTGRAGILDMLRDKGIPLFDNRGMLVVRLKSNKKELIYVIYCVHKSRYHSSFNQLHSGYREFQLGVPANIVVTSHRHRPSWGFFPWYLELKMLTEHLDSPLQLGGEVLVLQTGTYEVDSKYGNEFFGMGLKPKLLIPVLYPDEHRIVMCEGFEDARKQMGN